MEVATPNSDAATVEALKELLAATQAKLVETESKLAGANDRLSSNDILIMHLKLVITKLQR